MERDRGEAMDAAEWQRLAQGATKSITNTSLIKANYKVLLRWYMIPTRCAQRVSGPPPYVLEGVDKREQHIIPCGRAQKSAGFGFAPITLQVLT